MAPQTQNKSSRWHFSPALLLVGVLLLTLLMLLYNLWLGDNGETAVSELRQTVADQQHENEGLQQRNSSLAAEVEDLKSGEAAAEERARNEFGMIKPAETFYRIVPSATMLQAEAAKREAQKATTISAAPSVPTSPTTASPNSAPVSASGATTAKPLPKPIAQ